MSGPVIAHVLHRLYLAGAEVLAADLSRRLRDRFTFVFFCLDEVGPLGEQLRAEGFEVVNLQRRPGVDRGVARRMHEHSRRLNVRLLHAHQYTPFFYASLSRGLIAGAPPVLFTEHGRHYPDVRKLKRVVANRFLLRRDDRVTAVGEFVKKALVNNEGIAASRVEVIRNGIDPRKFAQAANHDVDRAAVRRELSIPPDALVIAQVARFHSVKDHETSIRGFAAVTNADARLLLVGDGDKRPAMEQLARELGVADRVVFAGVRDDVPRIMAAADLFVLSSLSEGISVTLLEAMGCGLPICATDVGGNGEVVAQGATGLLSPRQDPQKLAQNLTSLLADAALRRRMGDAGRQRLLDLYTQEKMHAGYTGLYEQMTA